MTRAYPVGAEFFVGATVAKRFSGKWFLGRITKVFADEERTLWHIVYSDFDEEDLSKEEMAKTLVHHPGLEMDSETNMPEVGSFVWFSEDQSPRLGKVVSVERTSPRPVALQLYEPKRSPEGLHRASFRPMRETESGEPKMTKITLLQIMLRVKQLSARGFLQASDRRKLLRCLA